MPQGVRALQGLVVKDDDHGGSREALPVGRGFRGLLGFRGFYSYRVYGLYRVYRVGVCGSLEAWVLGVPGRHLLRSSFGFVSLIGTPLETLSKVPITHPGMALRFRVLGFNPGLPKTLLHPTYLSQRRQPISPPLRPFRKGLRVGESAIAQLRVDDLRVAEAAGIPHDGLSEWGGILKIVQTRYPQSCIEASDLLNLGS